jgi:hypothetical protein
MNFKQSLILAASGLAAVASAAVAAPFGTNGSAIKMASTTAGKFDVYLAGQGTAPVSVTIPYTNAAGVSAPKTKTVTPKAGMIRLSGITNATGTDFTIGTTNYEVTTMATVTAKPIARKNADGVTYSLFVPATWIP